MDLEDEDEFGDLYTDVLRPPASAPPPPHPYLSSAPTSSPILPLNPLFGSDEEDGDRILHGASRSSHLPSSSSNPPPPTQVPDREDREEDWMIGAAPALEEQPIDWNNVEVERLARVSSAPASDLPDEDEARVVAEEEEEEVTRVTAEEAKGEGGEIKASEDAEIKVLEEDDEIKVSEVDDDPLLGGGTEDKMEVGIGMGSLDQEPVIPGLSAALPVPEAFHGMNGGDMKGSRSDDWDSDSDDDLQIVLNDDSLGPLGGEGNKELGIEEEDEDGEEDLVIVTDEDQHHHHHQAIEEQDWGEETMQPALEGERKDISEAAKANGGIGTAAGARIGYSGHGCHPQQHSQYKYVRPGVAALPGGAPGQVRPPLAMGPIAGRGRSAQKSFYSGYGVPLWVNNTPARAFGNGLEFTLPSHKTVFDIDIDAFEEKPWRHPGVDISDFFNFGLDEDNWKDYCKKLGQLRLESTMQSKIHVYESGRSEQDYDPDLPPELAAATGLQDISAEHTHLGKVDVGQADLIGQGRGAAGIRPQLPTGRAIQVEGGYGERLPSMDTRPPRFRDSDAVIEIVLQDSADDSITSTGALEQPENEMQGEDLKGGSHEVEEDDRRADSEYCRFPHSHNGRKRDIVTRRIPFGGSFHNNLGEGDGILRFPPETPLQYLPNSKMRSPVYPGGSFGSLYGGRLTEGTSHERYSNTSGDAILCQSGQANKYDGLKEKSGDSMEDKHTEISPAVAAETARSLSIEQRDNEHDDGLALGDKIEVEGEVASDLRISGETHGDNSSRHVVKKQKLSSRVEHPAFQDNGDGDDLRATHSDSSRAKSGSSKDYLKRNERGEEEVMQNGWSRQMGFLERHHVEEECRFRQRDDYGRDGRHEVDRHRLTSKGREDLYHSHPHRDSDSNSAHYARRSEGFERPKDRDGSVGARQKREDDVHGRRIKDEETKRELVEEIGSRHKSKGRSSERRSKDEDLHSRKRVDAGDWRGHHDREGGPRQRERDGIFKSRHENFDGVHSKRRKEQEYQRLEKVTKEDSLHGYRAREDPSRSKKERDGSSDHKRRDDLARVRDKSEDHHSSRHRDDGWRQREREDRQRLKQPHEDMLAHREREEGRGPARGGRFSEDRSGGNGRTKDEPKGLGSDKDYPHKDRRNNEQPKKDRTEEESLSQHKRHQEMHSRESQFHEERNSRHERLSSHNDRALSASDNQVVCRERHRENSRKSKETEGGEQNSLGPGKRKHEDHNTLRNEKVSMKGNSEQEVNHVFSATLSKKGHSHTDERLEDPQQQHSSRKPGEEDAASDDEIQQDSRRGRSKLERWTSHKGRDYSISSMQPLSSLSVAEAEANNVDTAQPDELTKPESNNVGDTDPMDADVAQISERMGDEGDRHLETVAKLKKRSERFKLPMPGDKDATPSRKVDNEVPLAGKETVADAEIKLERPPRKRRWISS